MTVHARCSGPLEFGPKSPSYNTLRSELARQSEAIRLQYACTVKKKGPRGVRFEGCYGNTQGC